MQILDN
jgi:chromosome segregation ATPase